MDSTSNFAYTTVVSAPSPATSGTSMEVANGSDFPDVPFNAWVFPPATQPLSSNAEIVRVTYYDSITQTFTITRAQEGTSAKSIAANWQIAAGATKKTFTDIESRIANMALGWENLPITLTYSSADDPTYVMSASADPRDYLSVGMRLKITQGTDRYFIITALSSNTITVYGGTDYDVDNATISSPQYSAHKAPKGFPLDPTKWAILVTDTTTRTQSSPVNGTWYNLGSLSITIPIGSWIVSYKVKSDADRAAAGAINVFTSLSTANNTEGDNDFTAGSTNNNLNNISSMNYVMKPLVLSSKTVYYLNTITTVSSITNIYNSNGAAKLFIKAVSAYL